MQMVDPVSLFKGVDMIPLLFWTLLLLCCTFAATAGKLAGRIGALMILTASCATSLVYQWSSWSNVHIPILTIDVLLLAGLYILALRSNAYWPIWAAGFHLISVAAHVATMLVPEYRVSIYWSFGSIWSLFVLMAMVVGIALDRGRDIGSADRHDHIKLS
jgi:hypothetical protein